MIPNREAAPARQATGSHARPRRAELALVLALLLVHFVGAIKWVEFHPDESQWIASSAAFESFVGGDLTGPPWQENYWTLTQPPLTRYLIGLGRVAGGYRLDDLNRPWRFSVDRRRNIADGAMPSPGLLWCARLPMAVLAAVSCLLGVVVLTALGGRAAGYTWAVLFLVSPYLANMLSRAMGEAPLLAAVLGVTFLAWHTLVRTEQTADRAHLGRLVRLVALTAVGCGVAAAIKLNGFVTFALLLPLTAWVGLRLHQRATVTLRWGVWGALVAVEIALLTFIAVNPYLYPAPLARGWHMIAHRQAEVVGQQSTYPESVMPIGVERVHRIGARLLHDYAPVTGPAVTAVYAVLALLGVAVAIQVAVDRRADVRGRAAAAVLLAAAAVSSAPTLFSPLDWDRYYLLPEVFAMAFAALGIARSAALVRHIVPRVGAAWWSRAHPIGPMQPVDPRHVIGGGGQ